MLPLLKTFLYSFVGSVAVPWISSKIGLQITPEQTTTLQSAALGGLIAAGSAAVHWVHQKLSPSSSSPTPPSTAKVNVALPFLAGMLLAAGGLGLTGCAAFKAIATDPAVIQDVIGSIVAIAEDSGTSEAAINATATQVLTTAAGTEVALQDLQTALQAIPGVGSAVTQYLSTHPALGQTEAGLNAWLQQLVAATTPGSTVQVSAQAKRLRHGV